MGELYIIWNWIREAKNTYESGAFMVCALLCHICSLILSR